MFQSTFGDSSQGGVKRLEVNHSISMRTAESSSKKRKRGRPRKNENVNFDNNDNSELVENNTIAVVCDNVEVESKKKEEMVMVNKNGVVVDFVALGNMEDPYGEED
ncbi:hypothetical protein NC651_004722 [Populus alba x Populus x berolinensis]|nr:hypothetical protein NC651_004722 [Populus alba x Populus x berolinensis]